MSTIQELRAAGWEFEWWPDCEIMAICPDNNFRVPYVKFLWPPRGCSAIGKQVADLLNCATDPRIATLGQQLRDAEADNLAWIRWANSKGIEHREMNEHTRPGGRMVDRHMAALDLCRKHANVASNPGAHDLALKVLVILSGEREP